MIKKNFIRWFKNIINIILIIFLFILIFFTLFIFTNKLINKDSAYSFNGYYIFNVKSGSMIPTLDIGDFILVKKEESYNIGDIITYKSGNSYITHRIEKITDNEIITKGDANSLEDAPIYIEQVTGKYLKKLNILKEIYKVISNKATIIFLLIILIIIIIVPTFVGKQKKKWKC